MGEYKEYPVSMTEMGIFLDWSKNTGGTAYNLPFLISLPRGTDLKQLKKALEKTFMAHPCLNSRFTRKADGSIARLVPVQAADGGSIRFEESTEEPDTGKLIKPFTDMEKELYHVQIIHAVSGDYLFLDFHHIIFDGFSFPLFFGDLNRAYMGKQLEGETKSAADIAMEEDAKRRGDAFSHDEEWYSGLLADTDIVSTPIHDRENGEPNNAYFTVPLRLNAVKVSEFVHRTGIRTSTYFTGVFGYTLSRFAGAKEALFASTHSGRSEDIMNTVGMFVKTFPVVMSFEVSGKTEKLLKDLDLQIQKSRESGLFSYVDICSKFHMQLPALFTYQGDFFEEFELDGKKTALELIQSDDPKEEIVAEVFRKDNEYSLRISYRTDLFEKGSMEEFARSYEKAASMFLTADDIAGIDITSPEQLSKLDGFIENDLNAACPGGLDTGPSDIVSMFRKSAGDHPDETALIIGDIRRTYREIDETSERIAHYLADKGIGIGKNVSILIHRNEYMITASLGVLKSGAAYQPLDPSYPPERLLFMVKDAGVSLVIADEDLTGLLTGYEGEFLFTKDIADITVAPDVEPLKAPDSHDLFTLLYTSGSTGVPKGVMLEHGNLANFCRHYQKEHGMTKGTVHSAYASYGFDANMMDMYPALTCGGCVCIVPEELRLDLAELGHYLEANNVSVAFMTTQVGRQFAVSKYRPACIKSLSVGGEKLVPMAPPEDVDFYNLYGPTECTIFVTNQKVDAEYFRIPIGRSFAGAALYVVDEQGRRVPPCVPGELWVAGPCVARGYLNRPDKTAESFTDNPFSSDEKYSRVYHTGDIVRFLPDGRIDFLGRNDGQVKIRGFRVELSEIEAVIREHPAIEDATVQAFDLDNGGGKYVAAYVVLKSGLTMPKGELESFIRERKPPYMVPALIMELDQIPLNQNQKVDKKKLPKPEMKPAENDGRSVREMTALEQELADICGQVTGNDTLSVTDILTESGLTSISTMRLMVELENKYGYSPDIKEILKGICILDIENELYKYLIDRSKDAGEGKAAGEEIKSAPLTQSQLGIYLECRMDETSDKYNIPFLLKMDGEVDANRLSKAVKSAVEAHPSMKCSIETGEDGIPQMISHPGLEWNVSVENTELEEKEVEKRESQKHTVFKMSRAPLFDFRLIRTKTSLYLSMVFHHILMDGTSVAVLMDDIGRAYEGAEISKEGYSILDLSIDEEKRRETDELKESRAVYDRMLAGVSLNSLPDTEPVGNKDGRAKAKTLEYRLDGVTFEEAGKFCETNKLTENALFTAAFAYLLASASGSDEALFASIYNGRTSVDTVHITGMLVKTYPIYICIDKEKDAAGFVRDVQKKIQELTASDLYSFAEAVRDYGVNGDVLFAYQGDSFTDFEIGGHKTTQIPCLFEDAKEPFSVDVWKKDGSYIYSVEYRDDMFTKEQMKWLADIYRMILTGMLRGEKLSDISLISDDAKDFLDRINDTEHHIRFTPVYRLFEENAGADPDRLAVITPSAKLTYRELNENANRVAHALTGFDAEKRIVSLMLPRSEKVYIVRQGILKAGAAFLSIDPDYPDERVRVMAEDSDSVVLITTKELYSSRREFLDSLKMPVKTVEELLENDLTGNLQITVGGDDLAYCIFTSGSTGKPKGVMLTHKNLRNFVDANPKNPEILGYTQKAKVSLALAAITFDVSVMEEFIPLSHGMTICMATEEEIHNPNALAVLMLDAHVDMMSCTPSFLSNCIGLNVMKEALANVRSYDFGAEAFPAALFGRIKAINPDAYIMNGYGPTEATISCTMDEVTDPSLITIGRPAANVRAYILGPKGNILPPLLPGELVIAGDGVGKGYIGRPELTAEKFFNIEGRPAYRTGDVAAWTSDGRLRFHGRADNQVKLRGLRVELGEIESAINAVGGVTTSIVIMTGEDNNRFLAGYYTSDKEIEPDEVKKEISKTLTPYMVPGVLTRIPAMPLTANGKIDKKKLPKVEFIPDQEEYSEPVNDVERDFCEWFVEVLNLEKVSATGNFFELGGTSLSASVIAVHASDKGYPVVYADIFKAQTPRMLAELVTGVNRDDGQSLTDEYVSRYDYDKLPLDANCNANLQSIVKGDIGSILLTGATGFLGMHVLKEYLDKWNGTAYCLLRGTDPESRLRSLYFYYFSEVLEPYLESGRVQILSGDITDTASLDSAGKLPFDTLINCAALVKHFVKDDSLERVNVQGVRNLIELCRSTGRRLIQVSTVSVAGEGLDGRPPRDWKLHENELYCGQILDNAYAFTKFKAEREVLEAVSKGLDAKIMRLGNLMGRHSDGEFQINFRSNAFIRSLSSYKHLGAMPYSLLNFGTDFSEIDMTAKAILALAGTDKKFTVFHPVNNHQVTYADIIYSMREYGFDMRCVEDDEFASLMESAPEHTGALIAYNSHEGSRRYIPDQDCSFTAAALYRLDFKWPVSGEKYLIKMLKALNELGMFE
ncbi:MAG: amino acid adenylation domain-containing protein [Lachnospiraceae bacterium]|nr:amino acid adenylation domain-containing protein [Lachnospiraceae bacterium]